MRCRIEWNNLEVSMRIGCSEAERALLQPVRLNFSVERDEFFPASKTDLVQDTIDVERVRRVLLTSTENLEVKTLEHFASLLESFLREEFVDGLNESKNLTHGCTWQLVLFKPKFGWSYVHSWTT